MCLKIVDYHFLFHFYFNHGFVKFEQLFKKKGWESVKPILELITLSNLVNIVGK